MTGVAKVFRMRRMRRKIGGGALLNVVLILTFISILAGIIAYNVTLYLSRESIRDNQARAKHMAHGVLQTAIGKLKQKQDFREDIVYKNDPSVPEQEARLTFDPDAGIPYSTNNTRSPVWVKGWDGPVFWSDGQVPPNSVHLVAVGRRLNSEYIAEAIVYFPPFPYALASSGRVVADGELEVLGVDSLSEVDNISADEKRSGHVISNSTESDAIVLNSQAKITGDVRAVGGIQLNGAQPEGEVEPGADEADIPGIGVHRPAGSDPDTDRTIYVDDYDPDKFTDGLSLTMPQTQAEGLMDGLVISGERIKVEAPGRPLELYNGVKLDDGELYVEGDVVIRGGLEGYGAVVATGKITVVGPAAVSSDLTALVSGDGVTLDGQGIGRSKFQGIVATRGDFRASSTTIAGAFFSSGDNPQAKLESSLQLENVKAAFSPEATEMNITVHVELKETLQVGQSDRSGVNIGLLHNGTFHTFTGDPALSEAERRAQVQKTYQALLGVQGQTHPLAGGEVVLWDGSQKIDPSSVNLSAARARDRFEFNWQNYLTKLESSTVEEHKIFEFNLNRFTSGSDGMKIQTYW